MQEKKHAPKKIILLTVFTISLMAAIVVLLSQTSFFTAQNDVDPSSLASYEPFAAQFKDVQIFVPLREISQSLLTMNDERIAWPYGQKRDGWKVVNFWATWCPPCIVEKPSLKALKARYEHTSAFDIGFVSMDFPKNAADLNEKMMKKAMTPTPSGFYTDDFDIWKVFDIKGLPTSILINPDGNAVMALSGDIDWVSSQTLAFVDELIHGKN
jgi:thiol-disulfide isomerase/thioredoxin